MWHFVTDKKSFKEKRKEYRNQWKEERKSEASHDASKESEEQSQKPKRFGKCLLRIVEIAEILSRALTHFSQKFRESSRFTKEITK